MLWQKDSNISMEWKYYRHLRVYIQGCLSFVFPLKYEDLPIIIATISI